MNPRPAPLYFTFVRLYKAILMTEHTISVSQTQSCLVSKTSKSLNVCNQCDYYAKWFHISIHKRQGILLSYFLELYNHSQILLAYWPLHQIPRIGKKNTLIVHACSDVEHKVEITYIHINESSMIHTTVSLIKS